MVVRFDNNIRGEVIEALPFGYYIMVIDEVKPNGKRDYTNTDKYGCTLFIEYSQLI